MVTSSGESRGCLATRPRQEAVDAQLWCGDARPLGSDREFLLANWGQRVTANLGSSRAGPGEEAFVWNGIRRTRSEPPGAAGSNRRLKATYGAALEQFEQLVVAASRVGPAARPLPLFYAIEQAARAVISALRPKQASTDSHGLEFKGAGRSDPFGAKVRVKETGVFPSLLAALNAPSWPVSVEMGALWSALPDLVGTPAVDGPWARPLPIMPWPEPLNIHVVSDVHIDAVVVFDVDDPSDSEQVEEVLTRYPSAEGFRIHTVPTAPADPAGSRTPFWPETPRGGGVLVRWHVADLPIEPHHNVNELIEGKWSEVAWHDRYTQPAWLLPSLAPGNAAHRPLFVWYALLYGLSVLARYHPSDWMAALHVDSSPIAVALEDALDQALTAVPHLIYEALVAPVLFHRDF